MISELIGLLFQTVGIFIVLASQVIFCFGARKEYGSVKKAFLSISFPRVAMSEEQLRRLSRAELDEALKKFPLAELLYDDLRFSVIGLVFTLIGTIIPLF